MKTHELFPSLKGKETASSPPLPPHIREDLARLGYLVDLVAHSPTSLNWANILPVAPSPASKEKEMPRRRYQRGRLFWQGEHRKQWVATFREDQLDPLTGKLRRVRRSIRLGLVKHMSKAQALVEFQKYLDAVNLVPSPTPKAGRTLKTFAEEW